MDVTFKENLSLADMAECYQRLQKSQSKVDALNKVFSTIVNRKNVQLTMITAMHILKFNLDIDLGKLFKEKQFLIPPLIKALIYYTSSWPGWSKSKAYYSGKYSYKRWYSQFKRFLFEKLQWLEQNYSQFLPEEPKSEESLVPEDNVQYELQLFIRKDNLSYTLKDGNLLLQTTNTSDNYLIRFESLLNLPYVCAEIKLPNLHISRKTVHEIKRFITKNRPESYLTEMKEKCADVMTIDPDLRNETTCEFAQLKTCFNNILVRLENYECSANNVERVLTQFLFDLNNCVSITEKLPVNLYFTYNIGDGTFTRQLDVTNENEAEQEVYVVEQITPKIQFGLHYFDTNDIECKTYDKDLDLRNCLIISCTFCKLKFDGKTAVAKSTAHFKEAHSLNSVFKCDKCRKQITYISLSESRWMHKCT